MFGRRKYLIHRGMASISPSGSAPLRRFGPFVRLSDKAGLWRSHDDPPHEAVRPTGSFAAAQPGYPRCVTSRLPHMNLRHLLFLLPLTACTSQPDTTSSPPPAKAQAVPPVTEWNADSLIGPGEKHFAHLRKLTWGGNNAEAYCKALEVIIAERKAAQLD